MILKKGSGEPFVYLLRDGSDVVDLVIHRFFEGVGLKKGTVEVHTEKDDPLGVASKLTFGKVTVFLKACDIQTTTEGVHIIKGDFEFDMKTRKLLQILSPAFCVREHSVDGTSKVGSALIDSGIACIGLLISPMDKVEDRHIEFAVKGIKQVLHWAEMCDTGYILRTLAAFNRQKYYAEHKGFYFPKLPLFERVNKGDLVGEVRTQETIIPVLAGHSGKIIERSHERPVNSKDHLFSIGEELPF